MSAYELIFIVKTTVAEAQRKKLVDSVKSWLKDAKIEKAEEWGQKVLSYPIKHEQAGFYYLFSFLGTADSQLVVELEKKLKTQEHILRHLLIRKK